MFEAKQAESQALYKNASKGTIVKSDAAPVNTGLSFHEAQQQRAQKTASSATNYGTRNIVQSGAGQGAQSVLSFSDAKNAENTKQFAGAFAGCWAQWVVCVCVVAIMRACE